MSKTTLLFSLFLAVSGMPMQAAVVFTLDQPALLGDPGQTVGWGFTMEPDPQDWITVVSSLLLLQTGPSLGTYADFIGAQGGPANFVLLPDGSPWTEVFNAAASTGVGEFMIGNSEPVGAADSGVLRVIYDEYSADPATCGSCFAGSGFASASFSVSTVPEPDSAWFVLCGACLLLSGLKTRHETTFPAARNAPLSRDREGAVPKWW